MDMIHRTYKFRWLLCHDGDTVCGGGLDVESQWDDVAERGPGLIRLVDDNA